MSSVGRMTSASRFAELADSPNPALANMPKGTLPLRHMTSRFNGQYRPEAVYVPSLQYAPPYRNTQIPVAQRFYTPENRKLIADMAVKKLQQLGSKVTAAELPARMFDIAMRDTYEAFGMSAANAPHAMVGPSEEMSYLAPPEAYRMDFRRTDGAMAQDNDAELHALNVQTARNITEGIISEKANLSRFHKDLGGAIHVLAYPNRPGPELRRGHQLNFSYFDDIGKLDTGKQSAKPSGIAGNRLSGKVLDAGLGFANGGNTQSVQFGEPNLAEFTRRL